MPDPRLPDPDLRAADVDRQAVATTLGRHLSDGRLTLEEYDDRVARAYAARTYGDLDALLADLPAGPPARPAAAPASGAVAVRRSAGCASRTGPVRSAWAAWVSTAIVVTSIWLFTSLTDGWQFFWPIWVVGPWGAVLLARTVTGAPHPSGGRRRS